MRNRRHNHSNAPDMHYIVPGLPFYKHFGNNAEMLPGAVEDFASKWYRRVRRGLRKLRQIGARETVAADAPPVPADTAARRGH